MKIIVVSLIFFSSLYAEKFSLKEDAGFKTEAKEASEKQVSKKVKYKVVYQASQKKNVTIFQKIEKIKGNKVITQRIDNIHFDSLAIYTRQIVENDMIAIFFLGDINTPGKITNFTIFPNPVISGDPIRYSYLLTDMSLVGKSIDIFLTNEKGTTLKVTTSAAAKYGFNKSISLLLGDRKPGRYNLRCEIEGVEVHTQDIYIIED